MARYILRRLWHKVIVVPGSTLLLVVAAWWPAGRSGGAAARSIGQIVAALLEREDGQCPRVEEPAALAHRLGLVEGAGA